MNVLAICGSRNPAGQTARALNALVAGAESAGCSSDIVYLPELELQACRQCEDDGWGECRGGEHCVIEDDLTSVIQKIREADFVVFATPVYFSDLSESLKSFLDRLRRLCIHGASKDRIQGTPAIALCVAGGGGGGAPRCAHLLETSLQTCGFDVVDVIPARRQNLEMKCDILRRTGQWIATRPTSA